MVRQSRWLMLVIVGLALLGAIFYSWYSPPELPGIHRVAPPFYESQGSKEPITPIPLVLDLDPRKIYLGRLLFNDPKLSSGNAISCAHCHKLSQGGTDGLMHPVGSGGQIVGFNTLTIFNSGFNFRYFWDGRAATLEDQLDFHLIGSAEMGSTWPEIVKKLESDAAYQREFSVIYPDGITPHSIKDAIAVFELSLTTPNSRFDRFLRGDRHAINNNERMGYDLFKSLGCISCHQGMNVGGNLYEKLGLIENYFEVRADHREIDFGRFNITRDEADRYKFRVPSLRNVALTAPYLHDGSAQTLEAVVAIMGKYQLGVDLRAEDINKIVSFLKTLTGEIHSEALN